MYQDRGKSLGIPDIDAGEYLIEALLKAGPTEYHATGSEIGLTWVTLDAFGRATQAISEPWEYEALRDMSAAYVAAKRAGENPLAIAPVDQEGAADD